MADDGASAWTQLELVDADVHGYCDAATGVCALPDTATPTADPVPEQPLPAKPASTAHTPRL
ncbi:hypothetical protein [Catenulispora pinisilvae]|uniref:hypothetical protein n=1 Tax=Catenulispora pinisilvae TaxID=2705253 RepID=UPI0018913498|nr:hypothetical protein [Catenulispora pinisilvae]